MESTLSFMHPSVFVARGIIERISSTYKTVGLVITKKAKQDSPTLVFTSCNLAQYRPKIGILCVVSLSRHTSGLTYGTKHSSEDESRLLSCSDNG